VNRGKETVRQTSFHNPIALFFLPLLAASFSACRAHTTVPDQATAKILLSSVESTFVAMKNRDYPGIWARLSSASRNTIVEDTRKAIERGGGEAPRNRIEQDFRDGGPVARTYWDGFLRRFDPDAALSKSRWEMGEASDTEAYLLITHEGAEKPAVVRLYKEDGAWKVGLAETFWGQPVR